MAILWIDLETRSRCDLLQRGLYNYAADRSTEILIASYALDNAPVKRWMTGTPRPVKLVNMLLDKSVEIRAHNAAFERLLLKHVWKLDLPITRFYCTSYQARSCALPAALADVGRALTAKLQKDTRGLALIRALSIPGPDGKFNEDPKLMAEFGDYCDRDVDVMRNISLMLPPLTDEARATWEANEIVNDRGLPIDTKLCELALKYADAEKAASEEQVFTLTENVIDTPRGVRLTQWVYQRLPENLKHLMASSNKSGLTLDSDTREALFAYHEEHPGEIDETVMELVEAAEAAAAASVAKFQRMLQMVSPDGRLRGAFIAAGASGTGRFSSKGAQLHNFPRLTAADPEQLKRVMARGAPLPGAVMQTLKSLLRPAIRAGQGKRIVRVDWNAIEARVLPWLTERTDAVRYLDAFRDPKRDLYMEQAKLCGLTLRDAGKVVVLALGYGGGEPALGRMCKTYGVVIEDKGRVVKAWRAANPWAPNFWRELDSAGKNGGGRAGRVTFGSSKPENVPMLMVTLPAGRRLHYPFPGVSDNNLDYLKAMWKPKKEATEWPRARAWGGLLAENMTQAAAADLLRENLVTLVREGYPVIGHVHDEIIMEASAQRGAKGAALGAAKQMATPPQWAGGLPLAVETDICEWYRK